MYKYFLYVTILIMFAFVPSLARITGKVRKVKPLRKLIN